MAELEKLFCALPEPKVDKDSHSVSLFNKVDKASLKLMVLEGRRAQNIVIALSQYKSFGHYSKLFSAVCSLENMNGQLTIDHIENLIPLLPTLSELKQVKDIMKSKHPAESKYFILFIILLYIYYSNYILFIISFYSKCNGFLS
jgi:hypothetical protein